MFPILCGIALILVIIMFGKKPKKEKPKPIVIDKKEQPVLIELLPKGTRSNPYICSINSEVKLEVKGYSDYKKENEVKLNGAFISYHKSCPVGKFDKEYGVKNIYYTPSTKGLRDLWIRYNDGKLKTSASLRILAEV
ncbi:MAG: hypothetical protein ACTSQA_07050 [Candidatus Heimdallarchaeaceae archaeon]